MSPIPIRFTRASILPGPLRAGGAVQEPRQAPGGPPPRCRSGNDEHVPAGLERGRDHPKHLPDAAARPVPDHRHPRGPGWWRTRNGPRRAPFGETGRISADAIGWSGTPGAPGSPPGGLPSRAAGFRGPMVESDRQLLPASGAARGENPAAPGGLRSGRGSRALWRGGASSAGRSASSGVVVLNRPAPGVLVCSVPRRHMDASHARRRRARQRRPIIGRRRSGCQTEGCAGARGGADGRRREDAPPDTPGDCGPTHGSTARTGPARHPGTPGRILPGSIRRGVVAASPWLRRAPRRSPPFDTRNAAFL